MRIYSDTLNRGPPNSNCRSPRSLVKQAGGLFIWCRTIFEYLRDALDKKLLLDELLSGQTQDEFLKPLYGLYNRILASAVGQRESDMSFTRAMLLVIYVAARNRPLSVDGIMSMLRGHKLHARFSAEAAGTVVKKLHAVLYVDSAANGAVRAHHTSLYDFIQWRTRAMSQDGRHWMRSTHLWLEAVLGHCTENSDSTCAE